MSLETGFGGHSCSWLCGSFVVPRTSKQSGSQDPQLPDSCCESSVCLALHPKMAFLTVLRQLIPARKWGGLKDFCVLELQQAFEGWEEELVLSHRCTWLGTREGAEQNQCVLASGQIQLK